MGGKSEIEWTEHTWNPITGCTKISPGCKYCYAEVFANRLKKMGAIGYANGFKVTLLPERLVIPLKRRTPTIYFVNSMSDLFHPKVPDSFIDKIFETITDAPQHLFQILTKRAERMAIYCDDKALPSQAWLGVSVENRKHGVPRIDFLRDVRVSVRFLSIEPLLEDIGKLDLSGIHWVIVGGESGPKARPMKEEWALSIRDQCLDAKVPFFFKQWGGRTSKSGGRKLQNEIWNGMPGQHEYSERVQMGA